MTIDGLTVLYHEVYDCTSAQKLFTLLTVFSIVIALALIVLLIVIKKNNASFAGKHDIIVFIILFSICSIIGTYRVKTEHNYEKYYVTIDDSVSYKDLTNLYKNIEQKGDLYIITLDKEK